MLTNLVTTEQSTLQLDDAEYQLVLDEDTGDGCVVLRKAAGDPDVHFLDDVFQQQLVCDGENNIFWKEKGNTEDVGIPLEMESTRFAPGMLTLTSVMTGASFGWQVFNFLQPRGCKQSLFWSLADLYKYFKMESYNGSWSIWASRQRPAWEQMWTLAVGSSQMIESTMVGGMCRKRKSDIAFASRCLP